MQGDGCLGSTNDSQTDSKDLSLSDKEGEYILFFSAMSCYILYCFDILKQKQNHLSDCGECPCWGQLVLRESKGLS